MEEMVMKLDLHHVGIVVGDIDEEKKMYESIFYMK